MSSPDLAAVNRQIAKAIALAQVASDAGKGIHAVILAGDEMAHHLGYRMKDYWILRAIKIIEHAPLGMFNYWVTKDGDDFLLIYFRWRWKDVWYQASFHSPTERADEALKARVGKGSPMHWVGKRTKKFVDSREAVRKLIKAFNL